MCSIDCIVVRVSIRMISTIVIVVIVIISSSSRSSSNCSIGIGISINISVISSIYRHSWMDSDSPSLSSDSPREDRLIYSIIN